MLRVNHLIGFGVGVEFDQSLVPGLMAADDQFYTPTVVDESDADWAVFEASFPSSTQVDLSNGDLTATVNTSFANSGASSLSTFINEGKFYFEVTATDVGGTNDCVGIKLHGTTFSSTVFTGENCSVTYASNGLVWSNDANTSLGISNWGDGDVICVAADLVARKIWFRQSGADWFEESLATQDPAAGIGGATIENAVSGEWTPCVGFGGTTGYELGDNMTANFGQNAFVDVVPEGFMAGWPQSYPAEQTLVPALVADADTFWTAVLEGGVGGLSPSLYSDTDTFFTPTIEADQDTLAPSLYTDTDTFFSPSVDSPQSHRYWRVFAETNNGDADFISCADSEWQENAWTGVNILGSGTAAASSEFSGTFVASNAFDQSYSTRWASSSTGGTNEWISYDFGSAKAIKGIVFWGLSDGEFDQMLEDIRVEYSDDNSSWTTFWTDTITVTANTQIRRSMHPSYATPANTGVPYGTHSHWRCYITGANSSATSIAEMEMRATPSGGDQCTGGTPTASQELVGTAADAFDNNNSTHWAINGNLGNWMRYSFASPVSVVEIAWRIRGDGNPTHSPTGFIVQFADSSSGPWMTAWAEEAIGTWTDGEQKIFTTPDYS